MKSEEARARIFRAAWRKRLPKFEALTAKYPTTTFDVTLYPTTGQCCVTWTDGATVKRVAAVIGSINSANFEVVLTHCCENAAA